MEHDIRDLFKNDSIGKKELPKNHRKDFTKKLKNQQQKIKGRKNDTLAKIIASFLLIFSCMYIYKTSNTSVAKTAVEIEVEMIEKEYLNTIDREWNNFLQVANDSVLINHYQTKLKQSNTDYQEITRQLKQYPNNTNVLESLVENLQRRLQLIKDIKEHVKELNQKNISNETIYL